MPEDLAGLEVITTPALDASAEAPIETPVTDDAPDIEKVRTQYEERIKGFQREMAVRDRKLQELAEAQERARIEALPDDERFAYERSRTEEEIARLRTENEVLRMSTKYTSVYDKYQALMDAKTVEEQFQLLNTWLAQPAAPSADPEDSESAQPAREKPAPVDKNNPVQRKTAQVGGYEMDDTIAQRLLTSIKEWPRS
jgi:hypothetical protein